jgi:hypothetical protein
VGRNIVSGLISGIRAMAGAIGRALLDILPGPLRKFAGALGINSPSTVFAEFGRNIGQGLIVGMAATEAEVTRGVGRLAAAATAGTAPARRAATARLTTPAAATAPAGPGVVFTGPITTTDVGAMADRILERQRDALALVSVVI